MNREECASWATARKCQSFVAAVNSSCKAPTNEYGTNKPNDDTVIGFDNEIRPCNNLSKNHRSVAQVVKRRKISRERTK